MEQLDKAQFTEKLTELLGDDNRKKMYWSIRRLMIFSRIMSLTSEQLD